MNPNDILTLAYHFLDKRDQSVLFKEAFLAPIQFLRDYFVEFGRIDIELYSMFEPKQVPPAPFVALPNIDERDIGPTSDPEVGFIYFNKQKTQKNFFRVSQKHKVTDKVLLNFVKKTRKSDVSEELKRALCDPILWWIEVRKWIVKNHPIAWVEQDPKKVIQ